MNRCFLIILILFNLSCSANVSNAKKIKDPIFDELYCHSNDIRWNGNKLITDLQVAYLSCEESGYIAYVFGEDSLTKDEVFRIGNFLLKAKSILKIEDEFDFMSMSVIDKLWITKNIYELRSISPEHHAKVFEAMKKPVEFLLNELEVEKKLLEKCDLNDKEKSYLCHVFTIQNRNFELNGRHLENRSKTLQKKDKNKLKKKID